MAKLIVFGADRDDAIAKARAAVAGFEIVGPKNNLPFFAELLDERRVPRRRLRHRHRLPDEVTLRMTSVEHP